MNEDGKPDDIYLRPRSTNGSTSSLPSLHDVDRSKSRRSVTPNSNNNNIPRKSPLPPINGYDRPAQLSSSCNEFINRLSSFDDYQHQDNDRQTSAEKRKESELRQPSVECQTDWSWLSSRISSENKQLKEETENKENKGRKLNKKSPISSATPEVLVEEIPVEGQIEDFESHILLPYPSRDDEYGILFVVPASNEDWNFEEETAASQSNSEQQEKNETKEIISQNDECKTEDEDALKEDLLGTGACRFCGKPKLPFPSFEDQETKFPEELYCCSEYREYICNIVTKRSKNGRCQEEIKNGSRVKLRDKVDGDFGDNKQMMKGESVCFDQNELETFVRERSNKSFNELNLDIYGLPMTTINYQLSSRKCVDWTIRIDKEIYNLSSQANDVIQDQDATVKPEKSPVVRSYENGATFLIIFPDGSGNVFYPSGDIALTICSLDNGTYIYVIQGDASAKGDILGVFGASGKSIAYFLNGSVRLCINDIGGLELDQDGAKKRKWKWNDKVKHIHAPPLCTVNCSITSAFALQVATQHDITLTFNKSKQTCRFHVGSSSEVFPDTSSLDEDLLIAYMRECKQRFDAALQKVVEMLRFPRTPRFSPQNLTSHNRMSRQSRTDVKKSESDISMNRTQPSKSKQSISR